MVLIGLALIPLFIIKLLRFEELKKKYIVMVAYRWGRHTMWLTGAKYKVVGMENMPKNNDICFISNHQSNFDSLLITGNIKKAIGFIGKKELKRMPIVNGWMVAVGCVFIDRKKRSTTMSKIEERVKKILAGETMMMFPEGTRSRSSKMKKFKKAGLQLLVDHNVTIVPITLDQTYIHPYKLNKHRRVVYKLIIHPQIETAKLTEQEKADFVPQLEKIINPANNKETLDAMEKK